MERSELYSVGQEWEYRLVVIGLNEKERLKLLEFFLDMVKLLGGQVGGGYAPVEEESDEQEGSGKV